jgi:hypothetical protein
MTFNSVFVNVTTDCCILSGEFREAFLRFLDAAALVQRLDVQLANIEKESIQENRDT